MRPSGSGCATCLNYDYLLRFVRFSRAFELRGACGQPLSLLASSSDATKTSKSGEGGDGGGGGPSNANSAGASSSSFVVGDNITLVLCDGWHFVYGGDACDHQPVRLHSRAALR